MSITCNAILKKTVDNKTTFSCYYGQRYGRELDTVNADNILDNVYSVSSTDDLERLPQTLSYDEVYTQFSRTFDESSGVVIHELTHYVVIFRQFLQTVGDPCRKVPLLLEL